RGGGSRGRGRPHEPRAAGGGAARRTARRAGHERGRTLERGLRASPRVRDRKRTTMSAPRLARFRERLAEALAVARERRALSAREYEALLVDPDFDDAEFERFRAEAA